MTLKEMDGLIVHAQHENGFWDCCTIQVGDWINIMDPPFKKYAYLITHTGIKTNTSVTAAENKTSEPLISSVDKVNPVPVAPPAVSELVDVKYAKCVFGKLGVFYYKGNGANLERSTSLNFFGEHGGIVNIGLYRLDSANGLGCAVNE